jgi:hypothetical protein
MHDFELDSTIAGEAAASACGALRDGVRVGGSTFTAGLVTRRRDQYVDRPCELVGVSVDQLERALVLARGSLPAECKLGFSEDASQWGAELVRELG